MPTDLATSFLKRSSLVVLERMGMIYKPGQCLLNSFSYCKNYPVGIFIHSYLLSFFTLVKKMQIRGWYLCVMEDYDKLKIYKFNSRGQKIFMLR